MKKTLYGYSSGIKWNGMKFTTTGICDFKRKSKSFQTKGAFGNQEWNKNIPLNYDFNLSKEEK